jgi:hypothetical protein
MNLEDLKQFRDPAQKPRKGAWSPPRADDFAYRNLIAFDPSLRATGVVAVSSTPQGIIIREAHQFPNPNVGDYSGNEESFRKAMELSRNVTQWRLNCETDISGWAFVHEAPPIGGGRIRHPESILLSSLAVRSSMWGHECMPMVTAAAHKKYICGNAKADKVEQHAELKAIADFLDFQGFGLITNEAKRDALAIALTCLAWEHKVKNLGKR